MERRDSMKEAFCSAAPVSSVFDDIRVEKLKREV
jgi:hypothetical protein